MSYSDSDIDFFKYLIENKGNCDDYVIDCEDCPLMGKGLRYSKESYENNILKIVQDIFKKIKLDKIKEILK